MQNVLPLLMETVDPQFVLDVVASIDPRLLAVLDRLALRDRVVGLYCEAELGELSAVELDLLTDRDVETLAGLVAESVAQPSPREKSRGTRRVYSLPPFFPPYASGRAGTGRDYRVSSKAKSLTRRGFPVHVGMIRERGQRLSRPLRSTAPPSLRPAEIRVQLFSGVGPARFDVRSGSRGLLAASLSRRRPLSPV
jgi:hypothetical protein